MTDSTHIHVGHNVPGYPPESNALCFAELESALEALHHELKDRQESYYGQCTAESPEQQEKGSECCGWCEAASNVGAALFAVAHGGAAWRLIEERPRPFSIHVSPPEGPDMAYWAEVIESDRADCEISGGE